MELHAFDHSLHQTDSGQDLHADFNTSSDLHDPKNLLDNSISGIQHDFSAPSSIGVYEPNPVHHAFDNQGLADYQPHHLNGLLEQQHFSVDHLSHEHNPLGDRHLTHSYPEHLQSFDHTNLLTDSHTYLDHDFQRLGSANFTPSSPADITKNKEVIFKDKDGYEHSGTIMETHRDDTYKIQTSHKTYDNVPYNDIQKYGSK